MSDLQTQENTAVSRQTGTGRDDRYAHRVYARAATWIAVLGLLMAVAYWLLESAIDTWVFAEGGFVDNVLSPDLHEFWHRFLTALLLVAGGVISAGVIRMLGRLELRNAALREELEAALAKLLSGFVPICMYCKNIRDRDKRWESVEKYLASRTDLAFSHGICPRCYAEHFPEEDAEGAQN
jgi:hypothetical protein